jgi:Endosomal/lysosomal potassium channel TMEM175/NADPH-dependent FMN reductase
MTRILGISGSLRRGSYNTALLRAAVPLLDAGVELEIALLHGIPLYDGDLEAAEGLPQARHGNEEIGMSENTGEKETARVEAFSDGVFSIAITLLILEIKVPHLPSGAGSRELLHSLLAEWPSLLAFVLSFSAVLVICPVASLLGAISQLYEREVTTADGARRLCPLCRPGRGPFWQPGMFHWRFSAR